MKDIPKALHECRADENDPSVRPLGFSSSITAGSKLAVTLPLMHGSIVEIVASKDRLRYVVTNPLNGASIVRKNDGVVVAVPYTGPREFRFEQDTVPGQAFKLAITLWSHAVLQVLHLWTEEGQQAVQKLCAVKHVDHA